MIGAISDRSVVVTYYNENDPYAAQWLRNLIAAGELPDGHVDDRSITDVQPDDLDGYTQCHFFAGIALISDRALVGEGGNAILKAAKAVIVPGQAHSVHSASHRRARDVTVIRRCARGWRRRPLSPSRPFGIQG